MACKPGHSLFLHPQQELNLKFAGIKEERERERAVESFIYLR
jgi:hypothetical protein